jgi:hypothetical protein
VSERLRCTNREFFNKKNPFGAFWFRSLNRKDNTKVLTPFPMSLLKTHVAINVLLAHSAACRRACLQPIPKKVKWIVVGGAVACVAVPLVVVASPLWLPVGGMVWVCRERAAIRADARYGRAET